MRQSDSRASLRRTRFCKIRRSAIFTTAVVTRWVRDANGNLLHENTWYSHYRTVNGITEVGPKRS